LKQGLKLAFGKVFQIWSIFHIPIADNLPIDEVFGSALNPLPSASGATRIKYYCFCRDGFCFRLSSRISM
jgi:hypothetical protein